MKRTISERFPEVRQVSVQQLSEWLAQSEANKPLLLDARARRVCVSHLPDAYPAANEGQALDVLKNTPEGRLIVNYCSVGYRSSSLARRLQRLGYANVFNLEGSIFEWANQGRPIYQGARRVRLVHPFDEKWGVYLKRELWSALPAANQQD